MFYYSKGFIILFAGHGQVFFMFVLISGEDSVLYQSNKLSIIAEMHPPNQLAAAFLFRRFLVKALLHY